MRAVQQRHEKLRALESQALPNVCAELGQNSISVGAVNIVLFVAHVVEELNLPHRKLA